MDVPFGDYGELAQPWRNRLPIQVGYDYMYAIKARNR